MDISIDVGGTKIACALIVENQILKSKKVDSIIHQNLESLPNYLFDLIKDTVKFNKELHLYIKKALLK